MKTIEEVRDYLLENRVNEYGNLNLSCLDFSDFDGHVTISNMKVKRNLYQNNHKTQGDLYQSFHEVQGDLLQGGHKAQGSLYQSFHKVEGDLLQGGHSVQGNLLQSRHEVQGDYYSKEIKVAGDINFDEPTKLLKEINAEELAKLGYIFKGEGE